MTKLQANDRWTSPCTYTTIPFPLKSPPLLLSGSSNFAFRQILSSCSTTPALKHSTAISAFLFADGERNSDDACFLCFCFFFLGGGRETVESDGGAFATLSQHGAASTARSSPPSKRRRLDSKATGATASSSSSSQATEAYAHPTEVLGVDAEDESDDDNDVIDGVPFDNGHSIGSAASASNARGAVPDARLITLVDEQLAAVASQLSRIGIGDISTVRRTTLPHIHIVFVQKKNKKSRGH